MEDVSEKKLTGNTKPSREQCTFGMTGCTGGWTRNHAVLHLFRGLHLKKKGGWVIP